MSCQSCYEKEDAERLVCGHVVCLRCLSDTEGRCPLQEEGNCWGSLLYSHDASLLCLEQLPKVMQILDLISDATKNIAHQALRYGNCMLALKNKMGVEPYWLSYSPNLWGVTIPIKVDNYKFTHLLTVSFTKEADSLSCLTTLQFVNLSETEGFSKSVTLANLGEPIDIGIHSRKSVNYLTLRFRDDKEEYLTKCFIIESLVEYKSYCAIMGIHEYLIGGVKFMHPLSFERLAQPKSVFPLFSQKLLNCCESRAKVLKDLGLYDRTLETWLESDHAGISGVSRLLSKRIDLCEASLEAPDCQTRRRPEFIKLSLAHELSSEIHILSNSSPVPLLPRLLLPIIPHQFVAGKITQCSYRMPRFNTTSQNVWRLRGIRYAHSENALLDWEGDSGIIVGDLQIVYPPVCELPDCGVSVAFLDSGAMTITF